MLAIIFPQMYTIFYNKIIFNATVHFFVHIPGLKHVYIGCEIFVTYFFHKQCTTLIDETFKSRLFRSE